MTRLGHPRAVVRSRQPGDQVSVRGPGGHGWAAVGHGFGTSAESIMPTDLPSVACRGGCRARGAGRYSDPEQDDRQGWGRRHRDRRQWDPGGRYAWGDLESARGRRGGARVDLVRQRGGRPGGPARADLPRHPDGRGVRRPAGAVDQGRLPDDCTRLLGGNDLGALFGLPLDSVAVRTTIGTPAPAVGRTERLTCSYARTGGAKNDLLDVNVSAYTDADAATKQWRTNAAVEDGPHRDVTLGNARGVLVERPTDAVLLVANGAETLTFVLPQPVRIRDLSAADTLVDLALRVLPAVAAGAAAPRPRADAPGWLPRRPVGSADAAGRAHRGDRVRQVDGGAPVRGARGRARRLRRAGPRGRRPGHRGPRRDRRGLRRRACSARTASSTGPRWRRSCSATRRPAPGSTRSCTRACATAPRS